MSIHEFAPIATLGSNCSLPGTLGIDFNDSTQVANFEIVSSLGNKSLKNGTTLFNFLVYAGVSSVTIKPTIGELLRPVTMSEETFVAEQGRLRGMNEHTDTVTTSTLNNTSEKIFGAANLGACQCSCAEVVRFVSAGKAESFLTAGFF